MQDTPSDAVDQPLATAKKSELIVRSSVPIRQHYGQYRQVIRHDFFYSCAYCTMAEYEAQAVRLTIDHYEPRNARPDLENQYDNLMYACDECNLRKGDRHPPPAARVQGHRFFRPDQDQRSEHFERVGHRVEAKTNVGNYSITALSLNRLMLRRLREIRLRLADCDRLAAEGVIGLRSFHIDQLPQEIKGKALMAINEVVAHDERIGDKIDNLLRNYARSSLIDPDPDAEEQDHQRAATLAGLEAVVPGAWRAPRKKRR